MSHGKLKQINKKLNGSLSPNSPIRGDNTINSLDVN